MRKTLMAAAIAAGALVAIAADCHDECCAGCCAHRSQNMKVGKLITGGAKLYAGGQTEPFARVEPPSEDLVYRYRVVPGVPFVLIDVAPGVKGRDRTVGRLDLPRITLSPFAVKPKAMSNAGLTEVDGHSGALGYVAVAEPFSRRGVVAGWLTNERASGVVASGFAEDGRVVLSPFAEYGRMLVREGAEVGTDTFAIGYFDDCRLGLEAYAETAARVAKVQLPPQIAGYTTWYPDRFGYSDRSRYPEGCGAGDEESTRAFADEVQRLNLGAYGFTFFQIDDQWQSGKATIGPARNFTVVNPNGPYPHGFRPVTDYLAARGIRTGLWWMPFGGISQDPWWADKTNLFVRAAADVKKDKDPNAVALRQTAGAPYETCWGGTCLDMTVPAARQYVAEQTRRMTYEWGMSYIKYDGMWTGYAADLAGSTSWKNDHFDNAVFADPTVPNVAAYRLGMRTMREAAKPGTFILGCNIAQNARSIVASFGLADAMRIGGDNGPIDMFPDRYDKGPKAASNLYFFNGRMWYNDPDPVYVRNVVPLGRARTFASFTALAGALYNFSDWLPDLAPARVEILKRTLAPHGVKTARPIDYFEESLPKAWIVGDGEVRVLGIYNWNTNAAFHVDYPCDYAGLDGAKTYVAFDFWGDRFCLPFKERLQLEVPADDCRVLAVREFDGTKPVLVSTSRHVASPLMDVSDERWEASAKTLCGRSKCVVGETYELRLWVPEGLKCVSAGTGRVQDCGRELRVKFDPSCDTLDWKLVFGD